MTTTPPRDDSRDALHEWRSSGRQRWRRTRAGWPQHDEAMSVVVGRDVSGDPYVSISPQRRLTRGPNKGTWTRAKGSAIHSREDYFAFLEAAIAAGFYAGFLTADDARKLFAAREIYCEDCGEPVVPDPAGSVGVWVHDPDLGDRAYDLNEEHAARPPEHESETA